MRKDLVRALEERGDNLVKKRAKRNTYPYVLKDRKKVVYIGITKNPERREQEHREEGKKFSSMNLDFPCSEKTALEREQEKIESYKRSHKGKKPKYN
jgi:predicted GIY-YIG superfamily endonuclease